MKSKLELLTAYEKARDDLESYKSATFYHGDEVWVESPKYKGPGVVLTDNQLGPDRIAVLIPRAGVRYFGLEHVMPAILPSASREVAS